MSLFADLICTLANLSFAQRVFPHKHKSSTQKTLKLLASN